MATYAGRNHPAVDGKVSEALKKKYKSIYVQYGQQRLDSVNTGVDEHPVLRIFIHKGVMEAEIDLYSSQFRAFVNDNESIRHYDFAAKTWVSRNNDQHPWTHYDPEQPVTSKTVAGWLRVLKASFENLFQMSPGQLIVQRIAINKTSSGPFAGSAPKFATRDTIVHKIAHNERTAALKELRKRSAARKIQGAFLKSYYDPAHPIGHRRLLGEFEALTGQPQLLQPLPST